MNLVPQDFFPQKKRYGYHYRRFAPEPVSFRDTQHINAQLQLAGHRGYQGGRSTTQCFRPTKSGAG